jgi:hypothetical protein
VLIFLVLLFEFRRFWAPVAVLSSARALHLRRQHDLRYTQGAECLVHHGVRSVLLVKDLSDFTANKHWEFLEDKEIDHYHASCRLTWLVATVNPYLD